MLSSPQIEEVLNSLLPSLSPSRRLEPLGGGGGAHDLPPSTILIPPRGWEGGGTPQPVQWKLKWSWGLKRPPLAREWQHSPLSTGVSEWVPISTTRTCSLALDTLAFFNRAGKDFRDGGGMNGKS